MRVSKKLLPSADDYVEDPVTGRRWPLVVETINGSDPVRGFWLGEPHRSAFIEWEAVADKRGVTASLKRRVRNEAAAQAALKEALQHPLPRPSRPPLTPGGEPVTPPAHGTLEWYRNELALAQERIQSLEAENSRLLDEKREHDPVMQYVVNGPSKIAKLDREPRGKNQAVDDSGWKKEAEMAVAKNPDLSPVEIANAIKRVAPGRSDRYLRKWVRERESDLRARGRAIAEKLSRTPYFPKG